MYTIKNLYINVLCVTLFCIDRILKYFALTIFKSQSFLFYEKFYNGLGFVSSINNAIAFSIPIPRNIIFILVCVLLLYVFYILYLQYVKYQNPLLIFSFSMILYGAVSNAYDRIVYGGVVDYVQVFVWPVFNIADVLITVGAVLWGYSLLVKK